MYEKFEHKADIGVRGIATTKEGAFAECAKAMFSVMVDLETVNAESEVEVEAKANDIEQLLVNFLSELLFLRDDKEMLFSEFEVSEIAEKNREFHLKATAKGEKIDLKKHEMGTEVKGVTYSGLKVAKENKGFVAQCIVDV